MLMTLDSFDVSVDVSEVDVLVLNVADHRQDLEAIVTALARAGFKVTLVRKRQQQVATP